MTTPSTPPAKSTSSETPTPPAKSKLTERGLLVFLLSFAAGPLRESFPKSREVRLLAEGLTVCFFIGIAMMIIGGLRNRAARKAAKQAAK